eukprot:gene4765-8347_t
MQGQQKTQQQKEQEKQEAEDQRNKILSQIMTPEARERLNRVAMVKGDRAKSVEEYLINAAKNRQLSGKVDEEQLITILEQVAEQKQKTKITIQRRDIFDDDEW